MKEKRIAKGMLLVAMLVSICAIIYIILAYSKYYFHSDCAGYLFLAKEQLAQRRMFPERFHYTTDIFFLTPSVTMIPFLAIFENELFAHELGIMLYIAIICILIFGLFWDHKKAATIIVTFFLFPLSRVVIDMFFSQGAYLTAVFFKVILLIPIRYLFVTENDKCLKKVCIAYGCFFVVGFLTNYAVISGIATNMLPILLAFVAMILIREGISVKGILRQRKLLLYIVNTIIVIVISGIHYVWLCNQLEFDSMSLHVGLVEAGNFYQNILNFPALVMGLLGWSKTSSLFSISTFKCCALLVYIVISQIVIPFYILSKVCRISNRFMQFIVLYVNISNFITFFIMVAAGEMESRYYLPIYFNNLLLFGLMGKWLLDEKRELFKELPAAAVLVLAVCIQVGYIHSVPEDWKQDTNLLNPKADSRFYDFLLEHDLTYGYATFWNAYPITVLSNEKVIVVAHDAGRPTVPYYFNENSASKYNYYAISEDYYNTELHNGRCFVLVLAGETIPEQYYQLAEDTLTYEGFTILVYGKNINEYPELAAVQ